MKRLPFILAVLGSKFAPSAGQSEEMMSASWCVTYVSTYLAPAYPVPIWTPRPDLPSDSLSSSLTGSFDASAAGESLPTDFSISVFTPTTAAPIPTTGVEPGPRGQEVIFLVVPSTRSSKRGLQRRALGGFVGVGTANPRVCTNAQQFRLSEGELLDGNLPIYYSRGDRFKLLRGQGAPPNGAATTTFANIGGVLQFSNSALPNGQAGFCQDEATGQVYVTFTSEPAGCEPVELTVYGVDQCQNGQIVGLGSSSSIGTETTASASQISGSELRPTDTVPTTRDPLSTTTVSTLREEPGGFTRLPTDFTKSPGEPPWDISSSTTVPAGGSRKTDTRSRTFPHGRPPWTDAWPPPFSDDWLQWSLSSSTPWAAPTGSETESADGQPSLIGFFSGTWSTDSSHMEPSSLYCIRCGDYVVTSNSTDSSTDASFTGAPSLADSSLSDTTSTDAPPTDPSSESNLDASVIWSESDTTSTKTTVDDKTTATQMTADETTTGTQTTTGNIPISTQTTANDNTPGTQTTAAKSSTTTQATAGDITTGKCVPTGTPTPYTPNPIPILVDDRDYDDSHQIAAFPFTFTFFDSFTVSYFFVSVNGILATSYQSITSNNEQLPSPSIDTSILPYWDDRTIYEGSGQGIWYSVFTLDRGRQATFEWIVGGTGSIDADRYRHFSATVYEDHLGVVTCSYYFTPDGGGGATVGQLREFDEFGDRVDHFLQHSFNEPGAVPGGTYVVMDSSGSATITTGRLFLDC
ncbi:hypothetical protein ACJZ2D_002172 [Fusarium nematophilum]